MKKRLIVVLAFLTMALGIAIAEENMCRRYSNGNGITVDVSSVKDPADKDITIIDYLNTIQIGSNGAKMRIDEFEIIDFKGLWEYVNGTYSPVGKIIKSYGVAPTIVIRTHGKALSRDNIKVEGENCPQ